MYCARGAPNVYSITNAWPTMPWRCRAEVSRLPRGARLDWLPLVVQDLPMQEQVLLFDLLVRAEQPLPGRRCGKLPTMAPETQDRKSTRLNSSHRCISYA